ncbi:MAG TPA: cupredoxin domain-containing protein [Dehalococcoidia bacterium]|nr:cupredoxin domain-containing protein [Dehalococcoidia bacterium]
MKLVALALVLAAGLLATAMVLVFSGSSSEASGERTISFHHSRFVPGVVTVRAGEPVTFTLNNQDPIEHEWIVGTEDVHRRHRLGTEPYHDEIPTEVTVSALSTRLTTVTFERAGEYSFVCHLPGHEAYGMRGTLRVVS